MNQKKFTENKPDLGSRAVNRRSFLRNSARLLGGGAALGAFPMLARAAGKNDPIKVGVLSPLTGPWTVYGKAHIQGAKLAIEEVNQKGVLGGRKFELVIGDTASSAREAAEQANRLVRREQVDFLAGTYPASTRDAAAAVATTRMDKVLLFPTYFEGQEQSHYPGQCNKNMFFFGPEPTQQVWPHVEYFANKYGKRFFLVGSDYAWPHSVNKLVREKFKEFDIEVVTDEVYIPLGTTEFDSVLRQIRASKPDVIFDLLIATDALNFHKQYVAAGMKDDYALWTLGDEELATQALGPDVASGTYVTFDYFMSLEGENNQSFLQRYRAAFGPDAMINTVGVGMYNAIHMAALALEKSGEVSSAALRKGLADLEFAHAPQGEVKMRGIDNQLIVPSYLAQVTDSWPEDGKTGQMFNILQGFEAVEPRTAQCDKLPLIES